MRGMIVTSRATHDLDISGSRDLIGHVNI